MLKRFIKYVSQNMLGMLGMSFYILADTFFISKAVGADGITALNLVLPLYNLIFAIGAMIGVGSAIRYVVELGRNEKAAGGYFFHAVKQVKEALKVAGFQSLEEENLWQLEPGKNYYVTRNESSLLAFSMPKEKPLYYHLCASHSDFPTFRIKKAKKKDAFYAKAEIEGYGGMIHTSWFDRPLGLAGRVMKKTKEGISSVLIAPDKNVFVIPNLSIHFNREINQGYKHNVHVDLQPLYGGSEAELMTLLREEAGCKGDEEIVDMDLILTVRQTVCI